MRFSRFGFSCLGQVQLAEAPVRVTGVRGRRPFGGLLADAEEGQPRDPGRSGDASELRPFCWERTSGRFGGKLDVS